MAELDKNEKMVIDDIVRSMISDMMKMMRISLSLTRA